MKISVCKIRPSRRVNVLAEVTVEMSLPEHDSITVDDIRVLQNRQGDLWVALPSFSAPASSGGVRRYEYKPTVVLSRSLQREVEDAVLATFYEWNDQDGDSDVI